MISPNGEDGSSIGYYQWVPLILICQAFLFYMPVVFWRVLNDRSGINIHNLVEAAETIQNALYPERRDKTIKYMVRHINHYLNYSREYRGGCCISLKHFLARHLCFVYGNRYGNYLIGLYLLTKIMFLINVFLQILLLNFILNAEFHKYGWTAIQNMLPNSKQDVVNIFPTETLCEFTIHQPLAVAHQHIVQCVLPLNLFNEKIYLILWFWFMLLILLTVLQFSHWIWLIFLSYNRMKFIMKYLKRSNRLDCDEKIDPQMTKNFVENYLRLDGIFVLKLVAKNTTDIVVADVVVELWEAYILKN